MQLVQVEKSPGLKKILFIALVVLFLIIVLVLYSCLGNSSGNSSVALNSIDSVVKENHPKPDSLPIAYKEKMNHIINGDSSGKWVVNEIAPLPGALLPYKRIIAFYGNLYSKQMGILGELPKPAVLQKLQLEAQAWQKADSSMGVQPALHYIAVTAQGSPGKGGKYRLRMPFSQIDSVLKMAEKINAIVFLDIQVGLS
ncbi:MAG: hypothetical protein EPN92_05985, partial [Chitinophagaceae bacterium]